MFPCRISSLSDFTWSGRREILFGVEKRDSLTVTQKSAYLVMPPAIRPVSYAPVKEIDFIGKKNKAAKGINDDSVSSKQKEERV